MVSTPAPSLSSSSSSSLTPDKITAAAAATIQAGVVTKFRNLLVALAIGYGMIFLLSAMLILYMRRNRNVAFRGDASAARKIILPAFEPLLWLFSVVSLVFSAYFCVTIVASEVKVTASKLETEVYYSGRLFVIIVSMVYMYQKSVTTPALQRAVFISLLLCTYNLPIVWYTEAKCSTSVAYYVPTFTRLPVPMLFIWAFISPPARASKRAIREYCVFVFVYYALFVSYSELFYSGRVDAGFTVTFLNIFWGSLCPLAIWRILKADTEHWRGMGQRACLLQSLFRQKHNLDERISSRGLHVLIEMHRKYIIDFAYLEIKHRIGVGSSAAVYNGVLNSKTPVAIKVYTPTHLVDETVAEFSHEAALCGALNHPNIVKFYGMCVCPPTICLVSELCQGSLDDITRALARRKHDNKRQQLIINLQYMIDAARAVAYLHSFSPAFLHRDIKPANFLVDARCVVKLTDFGESRSIPKVVQGGTNGNGSNSKYKNSNSNGRMSSTTASEVWSSMQTPTPAVPVKNAMTVRGTADYMAPELIRGKAGTALYGEAADVYSLAITLWDIVHPWDEKYPEANNNHFKVFETVLSGKRPPISEFCHPEVKRILIEAWEAQPEHRPSAQYILTSLESLKQELVSDVAAVLAESVDKKVLNTKKGPVTEKSITGQLLMQRMLEFDFVETVEEACRMGNGLMSAGFLHHTRHLESFTKTTELFFFDEPMIDRFAGYANNGLLNTNLFPPVISSATNTAKGTHVASLIQLPKFLLGDSQLSTAGTVLGERDRLSSTSSSKASVQSHCVRGVKDLDECPCRKLGKGLGVMRAQRKRFRRNKKWYAIVEESILTEKLLADEFDHTGESTYEDMSPGNASDIDGAILHESEDDDEVEMEVGGNETHSIDVSDDFVNGVLKSKATGPWAM
ncbi:Tkl/shk protein kinase [Globisporangium polare]